MAKEGHTYSDLLERLGRREFSPVYLLYGDEEFLIEEAVNAIIDAILSPADRGFNLDVLRGTEDDIRKILAAASAFPMTAERRIVVLKEVERLSLKELELLAVYVDDPSPATSLVLLGTKVDMRKKPFSAIRRTGMAIEFSPLYENQIPGWIERRVKDRQRAITPEAVAMLAAYVGSSLRGLSNEIEKLFIYLGEKPSIAAEDVSSVVGMSKEFSVFELQKAIGMRNLKRSAEILEHMISAGENVPFIIVMLTSYFTTLLKIHDAQRKGESDRGIASTLRLHPYFLREYLDAAGRFRREEIEEAFCLLAQADEVIKTSSTDPGQVMHAFLLRLLTLGVPHPFALPA